MNCGTEALCFVSLKKKRESGPIYMNTNSLNTSGRKGQYINDQTYNLLIASCCPFTALTSMYLVINWLFYFLTKCIFS